MERDHLGFDESIGAVRLGFADEFALVTVIRCSSRSMLVYTHSMPGPAGPAPRVLSTSP